jgi:hypothetical protein
MKIKNKLILILTLCFTLGFSTQAFAGNMYDGGTPTHYVQGGQWYRTHLSAAANIGDSTNMVGAGGFAEASIPIGRIEANVYVFNDSYQVIK